MTNLAVTLGWLAVAAFVLVIVLSMLGLIDAHDAGAAFASFLLFPFRLFRS